MSLRDLLAQYVRDFDMRTKCNCESCLRLRPQVALLEKYLKTRHVTKGLMHAITDPNLKQALIEEICLHTLNIKGGMNKNIPRTGH
jgi:hypothetical protein